LRARVAIQVSLGVLSGFDEIFPVFEVVRIGFL
jgi:hypothetical protein